MVMEASCAFVSTPEMERFLCERLLDVAQPIAERFCMLLSLCNLCGDAPRCALLQAARDSSSLLAHEAAFALGQMQDVEAILALKAILKDLSLHPIVRHEAVEALGATGLEKSICLLKESLAADPAIEVQETCDLALRRIEEQNACGAEGTSISPFFLSVDPVLPTKQGLSVEQLR